jgi:ketosteroid isomerase-like protein
MFKIAIMAVALVALAPVMQPQDNNNAGARRAACVDECIRDVGLPNPDLQRQEIVTLEREAARAIEHNDGTFFRRVYSEEFTGTLSRGQPVDKAAFINVVQTTETRYESVHASNIVVNLYRDIAVATCLWSIRAVRDGQRVSSQLRVIHVYLHSTGGYHVIASQSTLLPPYTQQPL